MRSTERVAALALALAGVLLFADTLAGHATPRRTSHRSIPVDYAPPAPVPAIGPVDTFVLATFTFDGAGGAPDAQGWTAHDISASDPAYFHVADAAELDGGEFGGLTVLAGSRSLWCGTAPAQGGLCTYATLPGYGSNWDQRFLSRWFVRSGDLSVSYEVGHHSEPGYDRTSVYYRGGLPPREWVLAREYDGIGAFPDAFVVPDTFTTDSVQILFRFTSDSAFDDQDGEYDSDGGVILDDIVLADDTGVIDSQNFESEAPGATATSDGDWRASVGGVHGSFAGLFSGLAVEQAAATNPTNLWGFFAGSTSSYACGGYPGQASVPGPGLDPVMGQTYMHNEVWSPPVSLDFDEHGVPVPAYASTILLEFDVYRDLEFTKLNAYVWHVRTVDGGPCDAAWQDDQWTNFGGTGQWERRVIDISSYFSHVDSHLQVALGVRDMCPDWCSSTPDSGCRSHAPLFDNVRVLRVGEITTAAGGTPSAARLEQNVPNPFNPTTSIVFTLAETGSASLRVYDVSGRLVRTLVDGVRDAGVVHRVEWDGRDDLGTRASSGVYFYRLEARSFGETRRMVLLK